MSDTKATCGPGEMSKIQSESIFCITDVEVCIVSVSLSAVPIDQCHS